MSATENARLDMAADVVIAAVESGSYGIGYWARVTSYDWAAPDMDDMTGAESLPEGRRSDAWALVSEHEASGDDRMRPHVRIDAATILAAMRGIAADPKWVGYGWDGKLQGRIVEALHNPDMADFDATDADCIVQYQMFKELVYG